MTNDNNVKCALHPTREHPSRACTPRGFTAQFDNSWDEAFKNFDKAFEGFSDMFANWGSTIKQTCTATNGSSQAQANAVTTHSLQVNQSDITVTETTNGFTIHVDGELIHTQKGK